MGIAAVAGSIAVEAGQLAKVHRRIGYSPLVAGIVAGNCRSIAAVADTPAAVAVDVLCSTCWRIRLVVVIRKKCEDVFV